LGSVIFDKQYSKDSIIVKYYHVKQLFSILIHFKIVFISDGKAEFLGAITPVISVT